MTSWIAGLQRGEAKVQQEVYTHFSPKMLSVCRMYIKDLQHAEDCMIKAFVKVFKNSAQFKSEGSFEGWIRRIMVNECLTFLRLERKLSYIEDVEMKNEFDAFQEYDFDAQELLDELAEGYKIVFTLFVIEGYNHKEISNLLNISESTSKSQLFKAKKKLREKFEVKKTVQK